MSRRHTKIWWNLLLLGAVAIFGILGAQGKTLHHGSKDPMQVVLGIALTFAIVILSALAIGVTAKIVGQFFWPQRRTKSRKK